MKVKHLYVDFSSIDMYRQCPRKAQHSLVESLVPAVSGDESLASTFKGTVGHECLDALYRGESWEAKFNELMASVDAIHSIPPNSSGSVYHLKTILETYIQHYGAPKDRDFEVLATEARMEMPLTARVTYVGNVDKKIAIEVVTGERAIGILDHKFSSSIRSWIEPTVAISDQFTGYLALAHANGIPAEFLMVDAVSSAAKALDEYKRDKPSNGMFARFETTRTDEQIADWRERTIWWTNKMIESIESDKFGTNQPHACTAYNGKCTFYDMCASAGSGALNIKRNSFKVNPSPWKGFKVIYE